MKRLGDKMVDNALEYIKEIFSGDSSGHDYYHIIRVYKLATEIAKQENADANIVQLAALLHDVDDIKLSSQTHNTKKNAVDFMTATAMWETQVVNIGNIVDLPLTHKHITTSGCFLIREKEHLNILLKK